MTDAAVPLSSQIPLIEVVELGQLIRQDPLYKYLYPGQLVQLLIDPLHS